MATYSIIVPVYNVAPYLKQCLDSLLNQTIAPLEIIAVNDGSTDESGAILDEYVSSHDLIRVIHQQNGGLSAARNVGIAMAKGDYIAFADSDDFVNCDYYGNLFHLAVQENLDIALGNGYYYHEEKEDSRQIHSFVISGVFPGEIWIAKALHTRNFQQFVYLQMYRRDYLRDLNVTFQPGIAFEDVVWTVQTLLSAKRVAYLSSPGYYYRQRSGSITKTKTDSWCLWVVRSKLQNTQKLSEILHAKVWPDQTSKELRYLLVHNGFGLFHQIAKMIDQSRRREAVQKIKSSHFFKILWQHSQSFREKRKIAKYYLKYYFK